MEAREIKGLEAALERIWEVARRFGPPGDDARVGVAGLMRVDVRRPGRAALP